MKVVIQRVNKSSVEINNRIKSEIQKGLLVLIGIGLDDDKKDAEWLANKVLNLRVFNDSEGIMNKSVMDINGELLLISQFTLLALTKKGNRPSYIKSANHQIAIPLYEHFIKTCKDQIDDKVKTGTFGADMKVSLVNDGPVTIIIDSKNKEQYYITITSSSSSISNLLNTESLILLAKFIISFPDALPRLINTKG